MSEYLKRLGIESVSIAMEPHEKTKKIKGKQYSRPFVMSTPLEWTEVLSLNENGNINYDWPDPLNKLLIIKPLTIR